MYLDIVLISEGIDARGILYHVALLNGRIGNTETVKCRIAGIAMLLYRERNTAGNFCARGCWYAKQVRVGCVNRRLR